MEREKRFGPWLAWRRIYRSSALVTMVLAGALMLISFTPFFMAAAEETTAQSPYGDIVTLDPDRTVDDDAFLAGRVVHVRGNVTGDLFGIGDTIETSGKVGGDAILMGRTMRVSGSADGDIRACAQYVTVDGSSRGNMSIAGQAVTISGNTSVGRNAHFAGNTVDVLGNVAGNARIGASKVTIMGSIGKDLFVDADELIIGSRAHIGGNVNYRGPKPPTVESGATIGGEVKHTVPPGKKAPTPAARFFRHLLDLIKFVVLGLLVALFASKGIKALISTVRQRGLVSFAAGVASTIVIPLALIVLSAIIIGTSAAWVLAAGYSAVFMFAISFFKVFIAFLVGEPLARAILHKEDVPLVHSAIIGGIAIYLITLVPYLGFVIGAIGIFLALGALLILLKDAALSWPFAKKAA